MDRFEILVKKSFYTFIMVLPFIVMYFLLFIESMETAKDRFEYIKMMQFPFVGREEIGISVYSYIMGLILDNPLFKLILFQFLTLFFIFFTIVLNSKNNTLLKILLAVFCSLLLFGIQFGVQLRIGFASALLVFLSLGLNLKPNLRNAGWYVLPCMFHMATIPIIIALYFFYYFNFKSFLKFFLAYFFIFIIILLVSYFLEWILLFFELDPYYLDYLSDNPNYEMRVIPFSFIAYVFIFFYVFFNIKLNEFDYRVWLIPVGLLFSFVAILENAPFFHKFMSVFFYFSIFYLISRIDVSKSNERILIFIVYLAIPFSFIYFSKNVFLF